jgi:hypothetical protein
MLGPISSRSKESRRGNWFEESRILFKRRELCLKRDS